MRITLYNVLFILYGCFIFKVFASMCMDQAGAITVKHTQDVNFAARCESYAFNRDFPLECARVIKNPPGSRWFTIAREVIGQMGFCGSVSCEQYISGTTTFLAAVFGYVAVNSPFFMRKFKTAGDTNITGSTE